MPLPKTKDVGKIMEAQKGEDKPQKQKVAIALSVARKAGAKIPMPHDKAMQKKQHAKKMEAIHERARKAYA